MSTFSYHRSTDSQGLSLTVLYRLLDGAVIVAMLEVCGWLLGVDLRGYNYALAMAWVVVFFLFFAESQGLYVSWRFDPLRRLLMHVLLVWFAAVCDLIILAFMDDGAITFPRRVAWAWILLTPALLVLMRISIRVVLRTLALAGTAAMAPEGPGWKNILSLRVATVSYADTIRMVAAWAAASQSRYVCVANVHMVMEGWDNSRLQKLFNDADVVVPDGMPLVWVLRLFGYRNASRVRGPDLMLLLCEHAARSGIRIGLYGGTAESLQKLERFLIGKYPGLKLVCAIAPPFRSMTDEEKERDISLLQQSGVQLVFVGLGCPKQETWMAESRGRLNAVMIGVGAAFDLFSGKTRHAPLWMQQSGLEWLFRLLTEPRRLWRRYFKHNPRFMVLFFVQWLATLPSDGLRQNLMHFCRIPHALIKRMADGARKPASSK